MTDMSISIKRLSDKTANQLISTLRTINGLTITASHDYLDVTGDLTDDEWDTVYDIAEHFDVEIIA